MSSERAHPPQRRNGSASSRFRRAYGSTLALGMAVSVFAHLALFPLVSFPRFRYDPGSMEAWPTVSLQLPPVVQIPRPPGEVDRPGAPLPPDVVIGGTLAPLDLPRPGVLGAELEAPPPSLALEGPNRLVRYDVAPVLGNRSNLGKQLQQFYPIALQEAGIQGAVRLALYVDDRGRVSQVRVAETSGISGLDDAASELAHRMEFLPALLRDRTVGVWISQRICFVLPELTATPRRRITWDPKSAAQSCDHFDRRR